MNTITRFSASFKPYQSAIPPLTFARAQDTRFAVLERLFDIPADGLNDYLKWEGLVPPSCPVAEASSTFAAFFEDLLQNDLKQELSFENQDDLKNAFTKAFYLPSDWSWLRIFKNIIQRNHNFYRLALDTPAIVQRQEYRAYFWKQFLQDTKETQLSQLRRMIERDVVASSRSLRNPFWVFQDYWFLRQFFSDQELSRDQLEYLFADIEKHEYEPRAKYVEALDELSIRMGRFVAGEITLEKEKTPFDVVAQGRAKLCRALRDKVRSLNENSTWRELFLSSLKRDDIVAQAEKEIYNSAFKKFFPGQTLSRKELFELGRIVEEKFGFRVFLKGLSDEAIIRELYFDIAPRVSKLAHGNPFKFNLDATQEEIDHVYHTLKEQAGYSAVEQPHWVDLILKMKKQRF